MFRRGKKKAAGSTTADTEGSTTSFSSSADPQLQDKAQEVMKDNLELMKDIVMKIREDPEFAKNIYSNCPRLQHLLTQYPDLRPIFENPKLVRINFEQVYRDAGGVLPEDEEKSKKKSWLIWFVNSPIFKVLKLALFVKKLVGCIAGGGFAFVSGCLIGCCCEDALEELENPDGDADFDMCIDPTQEALNKAADHMENPEVQEQMQRLLEDPDNLLEAIENDNELRALRDSNPLCGELMSDPDTLRVLTDPDNLRALGEAPSLIEADFVDPDSFVPEVDLDVETGDGDFDATDGGYDDLDAAEMEVDADFDEFDDDGVDEANGDDDDLEADEEDEEGWWDDVELEEQEKGNNAGDNTGDRTGDNSGDRSGNNQNDANKGGNKSRSQAKGRTRQQQQQGDSAGMRGIMASIGVAATDIIAAQIVSNIFGDGILPGGLSGGGGGADLDVDNGLGNVAEEAEGMINDDVANVVKDTHDEVATANNGQDKKGSDLDMEKDDDGKKKTGAVAVGAGVAGAEAGGAMAAGGTNRGFAGANNEEETGDGFNDEEEAEEEPTKKNRFFGVVKNLGSAISTAVKEHVAGAILGDDLGEDLVGRLEERGNGENDDEEKGTAETKGDDEEEKSKTRGFFGRGKR
ncbi:hypothetical protein IV203_015365 [Nitzschia inconspicua]|uniref:Uncharacterized protein n=1 Tax=Nitzschia inconspicua TaxID=303405 RepID=A0A9K3LCI4_9STRA|nr:hypothetical protein IV203_015365 [Nitzschia inconspicua]